MDPSPTEVLEALIAAVMAGAAPGWSLSGPEAENRFLEVCARHGVSPLVEHRLKGTAAWDAWPKSVRRELTSRAMGNGLLQALAESDLAAVLEEAAKNGIHPLILKGAALAHTHYPLPHLRPRGDTDLLMEESQRGPLEAIVSRLGYRRCPTHPGSMVLFQSQFTRTDPNGFSHSFDLHWRISNAHVFAHTFEFVELDAGAVPVPGLGAHAKTCGPVDALALACLHRVGHHANSRRLIWLYDIHLLAEGLSDVHAEQWLGLAKRKALGAVFLDGLSAACEAFPGKAATRLAERLRQEGAADEPSAVLLKRSRRHFDVLASDLRSVPGWSGKLRLAAQHLFPPPEFMLRSYQVRSRLWLPLLYPHRAVRGLWRSLRTSPKE